MKISFCLTTYSKKEFLEVSLQNYFSNKKSNYELIVSDGFSSDGTVDFLKELKQKNMIDALVLSEKRDQGEWEGFKKTLDHVTGDYFYLLTDDDYFDFSAIDRIVEFLENHRHVDFLIADGIDIQPNGIEVLNYHSIMKQADTTSSNRNGLKDGVCGLGLFIRAALINHMELFTPSYGKRTDKGLSLALMDSNLIGASTNIKTYACVKNEKSNSQMYNFDYKKLEQTTTQLEDLDKSFFVDTTSFKEKFEQAQAILSHMVVKEEIIIYESSLKVNK
jgi:glycosyltransferase involved in cell wall biosynthesis